MQKINDSLFRIDYPTGAPAAGSLLIAEPFLREEHFNHSVIALIDYEKGASAMGLILNKPIDYTIGEVLQGIDDEVDVPIYLGGPLSPERLFYIHTLPHEFEGAREFAPGLFIGGDFESVCKYLNMGYPTDGLLKFFVGYSGWDANQLEGEIAHHVWAVAPSPGAATILSPGSDSTWYDMVCRLGPEYHNWLYHPVNPQYN